MLTTAEDPAASRRRRRPALAGGQPNPSSSGRVGGDGNDGRGVHTAVARRGFGLRCGPPRCCRGSSRRLAGSLLLVGCSLPPPPRCSGRRHRGGLRSISFFFSFPIRSRSWVSKLVSYSLYAQVGSFVCHPRRLVVYASPPARPIRPQCLQASAHG